MDGILEKPGSRSVISNLSIVELESVLAIKMRTGEINQQSWKSPDGASGPILRGSASWLPRPLMKAISRE